MHFKISCVIVLMNRRTTYGTRVCGISTKPHRKRAGAAFCRRMPRPSRNSEAILGDNYKSWRDL
ncbi:hypothetical protein OH686_11920 [Pseudomonas sp. SO81]|nr:hypothetical protein OH686_11920 [Pseudomonas sp. SO81]